MFDWGMDTNRCVTNETKWDFPIIFRFPFWHRKKWEANLNARKNVCSNYRAWRMHVLKYESVQNVRVLVNTWSGIDSRNRKPKQIVRHFKLEQRKLRAARPWNKAKQCETTEQKTLFLLLHRRHRRECTKTAHKIGPKWGSSAVCSWQTNECI